MAYTTVPSFTDTTATATNLNTYIRDNQRALKDPPSLNYESNEGSDYTNSTTTFADVDSDFNLTIVTTGGDVICGFTLSGISATSYGVIDIEVDGTRIINTADKGLAIVTLTNRSTVSTMRLITGLAAGSHTFKLQFARRTGGGTATLYAGAGTANYDVHGQFWAREVS